MSSETVGISDVSVPSSRTKITSEIIKTKITTQQQQPDRVVVIQARIASLFDKTVPKKHVESLILLAEQQHVELEEVIQNTYQYHVKVEPCRNIFGAIRYALENGSGRSIAKRTSPSLL